MKLANVKKVAKWEFTKTLKSTTFLLLTFLLPAIMVIPAAIPILFGEQMFAGGAQSVAVIDETGKVYPKLAALLEGTSVNLTNYSGNRDSLKQKVADGEYDSYLVIDDESLASGVITVWMKDIRDYRQGPLNDAIEDVVRKQLLASAGLTPEDIDSVLKPISLVPQPISGAGAEEKDIIASMLLPFGLGVLLLVSVITSGQILMQGVTKEKKNRIVEILLSSLSATELLVGKVIGYGALGLLQILVWVTAGLTVASRYFDIGLIFGTSMAHWIPALGYFLLGYLMFASLFAAVGALVKDAESGSQMQGLVVLPPVIPLMLSGLLIVNPDAVWVRVMSFIPIFTPATMLIRYGATNLPAWEIAGTMAVLFVFVVLMVRFAARVFEGSILRFDGVLSLKEIRSMLKN